MYFREQRTTMKKAWEIEGQYRKVQGIGQHIAKHMESLPPARARRLRVSDETKRILDDTPLLVWVGTRMPASFFGYLAAIHRHLPPRRLVAALAVLVVGSMRRGDVPEELLALLTILLDTRESYARDIALDVRPHQKGFPKRNASAWTQLDFFE